MTFRCFSILSLFFFLLLRFPLFSQDSLINYYTAKAKNYLDKEKSLSSFYTIDKSGIKIFASANDKATGKTEYKVSWQKLDDLKLHFKECTTAQVFANYKKGDYDKMIPCMPPSETPVLNPSPKPLQNYKIAIDAGHIAADMLEARIEARHIEFKKDSTNGLTDSVEFAEASLAFATAKLLEEKLEAVGATVLMTRSQPGYTAFGKTYQQWLTQDFKNEVETLFSKGEINAQKKKWYLTKASKEDIFRLLFRDLELKKRADIINDFKPAFTIIIHYNVDENNTGWKKPGSKDFNMTFVGGAFYKNGLSSPEKRFQFLRLLVTEDLESSILLSSQVVASFEQILQVKTATTGDATYLRKYCMETNEKGVFCRNLYLTHYVQGTLVYGETLYQDCKDECLLLNKETDKTKNLRVQQVAEAYHQGILNYISSLVVSH